MKTCLMRYISTVLNMPERDLVKHNAEWKSWLIHRLLLELGLTITPLNWRGYNLNALADRTFDVIFDILDLRELMPFAHENTVKILLLTGADNVGRNAKAMARLDELNKRRNANLRYYRYIKNPTAVYESIDLADYCIITGNMETIRTYPERYWQKIRPINVTSANAWRWA